MIFFFFFMKANKLQALEVEETNEDLSNSLQPIANNLEKEQIKDSLNSKIRNKSNKNNYYESGVIINTCFRENINKNESKLIECNGNDFGYVIKYFNDNNCQNMNNISIEIYNENECINNELDERNKIIYIV